LIISRWAEINTPQAISEEKLSFPRRRESTVYRRETKSAINYVHLLTYNRKKTVSNRLKQNANRPIAYLYTDWLFIAVIVPSEVQRFSGFPPAREWQVFLYFITMRIAILKLLENIPDRDRQTGQ